MNVNKLLHGYGIDGRTRTGGGRCLEPHNYNCTCILFHTKPWDWSKYICRCSSSRTTHTRTRSSSCIYMWERGLSSFTYIL